MIRTKQIYGRSVDDQAKQINCFDAHALMEQGVPYIDVRSEEEFLMVHPAGAFHIPWMEKVRGMPVVTKDFVALVKSIAKEDQELIVGCAAGVRSMHAADLLRTAGFKKVYNQFGGTMGRDQSFPGWVEAGLPTSSSPLEGHDISSIREKAKISS